MKFLTAKRELAKLACGRYRRLQYGLVTYSSGLVEEACEVYIDGYPLYTAKTWKEALAKMRAYMNPVITPIDSNQAPVEDGENVIH
jgi:hypothetical protein